MTAHPNPAPPPTDSPTLQMARLEKKRQWMLKTPYLFPTVRNSRGTIIPFTSCYLTQLEQELSINHKVGPSWYGKSLIFSNFQSCSFLESLASSYSFRMI